ncbi:hypothetical protein L1887_39770 [Cichorium endivia]|nr:hypothetical protein L1887_39770 [Cichorium endivia]
MSLKVPSDLINQSQIGFRQDAGLSSFNPQDPTLNPLPTVRHSISALDSSPSRLECKHCEENLLRGSQSLICIYCGQCQANDQPPEPLLFNSTTGYRWLLQSLSLNPSEMIEPLVEEKRRNKVGTPVEDGRALSEFLDVQIKWPNEVEIPETSYVNKMLDHVSSFTVNTVGSYNFEQRDSGSDASEEHTVSSRNDQSDGFEDEDNLSLFQKADVSETAAMDENEEEIESVKDSKTPSDSKTTVYHDFSGYGSSGYDTDFQSGISRWDSKPSTARSSDFKRDSSSGDDAQIQSTNSTLQIHDSESVDHIDSIPGYKEDLNTQNLNNNLEPYSDKIQEKPIHKD